MGKNKKVGKYFSGLQNGAIKGLQFGASFRDYKSGQEGCQIGAKRLQIGAGISNRDKEISNRGRGYKSR